MNDSRVLTISIVVFLFLIYAINQINQHWTKKLSQEQKINKCLLTPQTSANTFQGARRMRNEGKKYSKSRWQRNSHAIRIWGLRHIIARLQCGLKRRFVRISHWWSLSTVGIRLFADSIIRSINLSAKNLTVRFCLLIFYSRSTSGNLLLLQQ